MNKDFLDLLRSFGDGGVRFLVVGAYALAVHGRPRATGDLDVWVEPTPENAPKVVHALQSFGAPLGGLSIDDLSKPGVVFQIGVEPRRIDVLTRITGVSFESAWPNRKEVLVEGLNIPVIGRGEFIKNKRATGRLKDLADADSLEAGDR
ncbi:MAG: hypothetical protein HY897_03585 [Deltaproteobacteria bacterium]|nr:hypothetical protein [Deltaproteobacteria bacterium]